MNYYSIQLFLTSGILIRVWSNLLYQMNEISFKKLNNLDDEDIIQNLKNNDIIL